MFIGLSSRQSQQIIIISLINLGLPFTYLSKDGINFAKDVGHPAVPISLGTPLRRAAHWSPRSARTEEVQEIGTKSGTIFFWIFLVPSGKRLYT